MTTVCSGMSYADFQVGLLLEGDDVPSEEMVRSLRRLLSDELLQECEEHPRHYVITPDGLLALAAALEANGG